MRVDHLVPLTTTRCSSGARDLDEFPGPVRKVETVQHRGRLMTEDNITQAWGSRLNQQPVSLHRRVRFLVAIDATSDADQVAIANGSSQVPVRPPLSQQVLRGAKCHAPIPRPLLGVHHGWERTDNIGTTPRCCRADVRNGLRTPTRQRPPLQRVPPAVSTGGVNSARESNNRVSDPGRRAPRAQGRPSWAFDENPRPTAS
ncbi:hypothetical protein GCM10027030_18680 [Luteococcus sediminum]